MRAKLQRPAVRKVRLFILDSGWPNPSAYKNSQNDLFELLNSIRAKWLLPRSNRHAGVSFKEPVNDHCKKVESSLEGMYELDPLRQIKVIYVPMTREQNADSILSEILFLHFIYQNRYLFDFRLAAPSLEIIAEAEKDAKAVLDRLPGDAKGEEVKTDAALLSGLYEIANEGAGGESPAGIFFVNESWTVYTDTLDFNFAPEGYPRGIAVAAAGNVPGLVVKIEKSALDFAQRCLPPQQVVTVVNMDSSGTQQCETSIVRDDKLTDTLAIGYDGHISNGECATSFASPRAAFFLSFLEATRTCSSDRTTWLLGLQKRLLRSRSSKPKLGSLLLDPENLMKLSYKEGDCGQDN